MLEWYLGKRTLLFAKHTSSNHSSSYWFHFIASNNNLFNDMLLTWLYSVIHSHINRTVRERNTHKSDV